jgi:hypothetical protein
MKSNFRTPAVLATGLLLVAGVLAGGSPASAGDCFVTLVTTKADGTVDSSVPLHSVPCREGEDNGGTEYYNPYTDDHWYYGPGYHVPSQPLSGGTPSSSGNIASGTPTTACTPTVTGGTKTRSLTTVKPSAVPSCPAGSTTTAR